MKTLTGAALIAAVALGAVSALAAPAIAQVQVLDGVTGRLRTLPLCVFSPWEDSFVQFLYSQTWVCRSSSPDSAACTGPEYGRPTNTTYVLWPKRPVWVRDMAWPDGSALYGTWDVRCGRNPSSATRDTVLGTDTEGDIVTPPPYDDRRFLDAVVAHLPGGFVEHLRDAYVQSGIRLARNEAWSTSYEDDLEVAIQVLGEDGWEDVVARSFTTDKTQRTYTVEGYAPPLTDVRTEVRYQWDRNNHIGAGYSVTDAQIFVETCVPDAGNPGECLSCSASGATGAAATSWLLIGAALIACARRRSRRPAGPTTANREGLR